MTRVRFVQVPLHEVKKAVGFIRRFAQLHGNVFQLDGNVFQLEGDAVQSIVEFGVPPV